MGFPPFLHRRPVWCYRSRGVRSVSILLPTASPTSSTLARFLGRGTPWTCPASGHPLCVSCRFSAGRLSWRVQPVLATYPNGT